MIRIVYNSAFKKDEVYDADSFNIIESVPFRHNGLYLYKGEKKVAFIANVDEITRVLVDEVTVKELKK